MISPGSFRATPSPGVSGLPPATSNSGPQQGGGGVSLPTGAPIPLPSPIVSTIATAPSGILTVTQATPTNPEATLTFANQSANTVLAGPATGSPAAPGFRALGATDIPDLSSLYEPVLGNPSADGYVLSSTALGARSWIPPASGGGDMFKADNLSGLANYSTARTNLGLGTAATHAATDFDASGAAAAITLSGLGGVPTSRQVNGHALTSDVTVTKSDLGLGSVENTALSTWAGSTNLTTLGTVATGVWHGTSIADSYIASASTWNAKMSAFTLGNSLAFTGSVLDTIQDIRTSASPVFTKISSGTNSVDPTVPTNWAVNGLGTFGVIKAARTFACAIITTFGPTPYAELATYKYDDNTTFPLVLNSNGGPVFIGFPASFTTSALLNVVGSIQSASPSGGTAQPWKLGSIVTATSVLDTTRYVQAEINGVACKLALIT